MIINTGSRTDIPAFYSEWFYNRIREGYVLVRSPFAPQNVTRYRLDPSVVDLISFCTKNPSPMLGRLHELDAFRTFFMVTITPYGREIEPGVPEVEEVVRSFAALSAYAGRDAVSWRYDPVFISEKYTVEFHKKAFREIAEKLMPYTDQCVVSFIDLYEKTKRNFLEVRPVTKAEQEELIASFAETLGELSHTGVAYARARDKAGASRDVDVQGGAGVSRNVDVRDEAGASREAPGRGTEGAAGGAKKYSEVRDSGKTVSGMQIHLCLEDASLVRPGVDADGCFAQAVAEKAIGRRLIVPRHAPARLGCACLLGADIGAYNTCGHGCRYCYANYDEKLVQENMRQHDPASPLLIGHVRDTDVIHDAKQSSWVDPQMNLSDFLGDVS